MSVLDLARADVRALVPYSSARMEAAGGELFLNANESAWDDGLGLNRYPDPQPKALVERLAQLYGVAPGQVLVSRGSDEAIDLLVRAFCAAGESAVLISPPTFGMYAVCARVQGATVIESPLRPTDFSLDIDALLAAVTPSVRLVFVCSPNNPTGALVPRDGIERLAKALAGRAVLVVDEAYIEFAGQGSAATLVQQHDHVCVLRTLSKAYALAGARIGCLLGDESLVGLLRRIMAPYPLATPCTDAALQALASPAFDEALVHVGTIRHERERMARRLRTLPSVREVMASDANFLTVRLHDVAASQAALLAAGIVVRDVRRYTGLDDALRLTIGRPQDNDRVWDILATIAVPA
ncbi:histidinol-phosphate transaminase [Pinirhizobacter soli]|uniref:histidinol-phosphate transaminase n=1 Tax=Pinirhizobacter soli TaxID=2786953 RepID=UPI00202A1AED|nr:histidinol-phosphate transaminase [Pinirhizobacter soli]